MTTLVGKSRKEEGGGESRVGMGVQRKGQNIHFGRSQKILSNRVGK